MKQHGKLFRRPTPDLKRNQRATDDVPRLRADLINEACAAIVARRQFGLHMNFGDGPGGVAAHDAEAVRAQPLERFFLPRRFDSEPLQLRRDARSRGALRRLRCQTPLRATRRRS